MNNLRNLTDAELLRVLDATEQMPLITELARRLSAALRKVVTDVECPVCGVMLQCDITEDSFTLEEAPE